MNEQFNIDLNLNNLLSGSGTFRFYLKDEYRNKIFSALRERYGDWRIVARSLGIDARNLFGLRRGWEYRSGRKRQYRMNVKLIKNIQNLLDLKKEDIEMNVTSIKLGHGGKRSKIKLPTRVDLNIEPIYTVKRALAEYIFMNEYKKDFDLSEMDKSLQRENNYVSLTINIGKDVINKLAKRGLCPKLIKGKENYIIYYKNPNVKKVIRRIIPKKIIFDEIFAKEFGKWYGDRCGGSHQVGLTSKERDLIEAFYQFLITKLNQTKSAIKLSLEKRRDRANVYYRVVISNTLLREKVFNFPEDNIFPLLYNSKKSVRCAFYAGLFEAEGSISPTDKDFVIVSSGFNMSKKRVINKEKMIKILDLFKKIIKLSYLLEDDGFNPRISRKFANTEKSFILKYDIRLILTKNLKEKVKFIKGNIFPYVIYKDKLKRFKEMEETILMDAKKKKIDKTIEQPEINIGLIGHC